MNISYKECSANTVSRFFFKPLRTIRQHLVSVKDHVIDEQECGVIFSIHCKDCNAKYVGKQDEGLARE